MACMHTLTHNIQAQGLVLSSPEEQRLTFSGTASRRCFLTMPVARILPPRRLPTCGETSSPPLDWAHLALWLTSPGGPWLIPFGTTTLPPPHCHHHRYSVGEAKFAVAHQLASRALIMPLPFFLLHPWDNTSSHSKPWYSEFLAFLPSCSFFSHFGTMEWS